MFGIDDNRVTFYGCAEPVKHSYWRLVNYIVGVLLIRCISSLAHYLIQRPGTAYVFIMQSFYRVQLYMPRHLTWYVQNYILLWLFYYVTTKARMKRDKEMRTLYTLNEMLMSLPVVTLLWQGSRSRIYVAWWRPRSPGNSFTSYSNAGLWFFPCC